MENILIKERFIYKRLKINEKKQNFNFKNFIKYLIKNNKIFIIFFFLFYFFFQRKKKNFFKFNFMKNTYFFEENKYFINKYLKLKNVPSYINENNSLINEERINFLNFLSKETHKNITLLDTLFYTPRRRFGNALCNLNKIIFYCEIVGCKKIILDKKIFWFIKNKIILKENNITIEINKKQRYKNYKNTNILYYDSFKILFYSYKIKPEIKINFLKFEIIKYLPKIEINKDYLYIHLRGEDIFNNRINSHYSQPPLCFYYTILNNFLFKKIYLISKDENNPVTKKLINFNSDIIHKRNSLKEDISYLINAYNIVASISSFLVSIIHLNINIKYLWDYNIYQTADKLRHFHYDFYKTPNTTFTLYRMESSNNYKQIMYKWKNSRKQKKLMIKEKCKNFFSIINYK